MWYTTHSSQYFGVTWVKSLKKWRAQINCKGATPDGAAWSSKFLGTFRDELSAARAVDDWLKVHLPEKYALKRNLPY